MVVAPGAHGAGPTAELLPPPTTLADLGLATGDRVRWHEGAGTRWREGRVVGRERDGSVGVRDGRGASRALRVERLEVATKGPRGGATWEPVTRRATRGQQLALGGAPLAGPDHAPP